jgi:hypothetical protein
MKNYFPILVSKAGEYVAMQHLTQKVKDDLCPIVQVIREALYKPMEKTDKREAYIKYPQTLLKFLTTHWSFFGNAVILDFSMYSQLESDITLVRQLFADSMAAGVTFIPAVQKNSPPAYIALVKEIVKKNGGFICIRTSNSSGDLLTFESTIVDLLKKIGTDQKRTSLLYDIGQIDVNDYNTKAQFTGMAIKSLSVKVDKWAAVIVSSSSFPETLTELPRSDKGYENGHEVKRLEWEAWKTLMSVSELKSIKYSDYGTRSSVFKDIKYSGTVSIKYTTKDSYVIFKGQKSEDHDDGHGQYITHSKNLVKSNHYSGEDYSWGDEQYFETSKKSVKSGSPGNSTTWVQHSQNHHITLLRNLL